MISKTLAIKLKKVLPTLISLNQTAYVKKRFISDRVRLISEIELSNALNIDGFLVTVDIEKAVDSVNYTSWYKF